MKLASKARQEINIDAANELLENVQQIAEIFYKTKNVKPIRIKSVYPTGLEIVFYQ
jgi:nickel superoxide dismutase